MAFREPPPRPQPQMQKTPPSGRGPGAIALATMEPPSSPPPAKAPEKKGWGCGSYLIAAFALAGAVCFGREIWKDYMAQPVPDDNPPPAAQPSEP